MATTATPIRTLNCPSCGTGIDQYIATSRYFGCASCNMVFEADNGNIVQRVGWVVDNDPKVLDLKPGMQATIEGNNYALTGCMRKIDDTREFFWREYMLYDATNDKFVTLAEVDGNWMLIEEADADHYEYDPYAGRADKYVSNTHVREKATTNVFYHFASYTFDLQAAVGEFDWDVMAERDDTKVDEYICPPNIVVTEERGGMRYWYRGKHIDRNDVASAFGLINANYLRDVSAQGAIAPHWTDTLYAPIARLTGILLLVVAAIYLGLYLGATPAMVLSQRYEVTADSSSWGSDAMHPIRTESFKLHRSGAVDVNVSTPLDNDWMELTVTLVNEKSGQEFEATKALEHYHGYDGGESWSEGSNDEDILFSAVPSGDYHLNIFPFAEKKENRQVYVSVEQNTMLHSNFWTVIIVVLTGWYFAKIIAYNVDNARWGIESD